MARHRDDIRLWRDAALGGAGVELLAGHFFEHRYKPHFHDELVIAAINGGAQLHRIGRHRGVAGPGCVLIIPPGELHTGEAAAENGWAYRAFYPDPATLAALASDLYAGSGRESVSFDPLPLHDDTALARQLTSLHHAIEANPQDPLLRQRCFAAAMGAIIARYARPMPALRRPGSERAAIRRAIDCARARFADSRLETTELAEAAGLSLYHFMRCFRAATGLTAHGFVVQLRLGEARRLLAEGQPAAEVAATAGFADQSHLIRHFRAAFGVTPGQYSGKTRQPA